MRATTWLYSCSALRSTIVGPYDCSCCRTSKLLRKGPFSCPLANLYCKLFIVASCLRFSFLYWFYLVSMDLYFLRYSSFYWASRYLLLIMITAILWSFFMKLWVLAKDCPFRSRSALVIELASTVAVKAEPSSPQPYENYCKFHSLFPCLFASVPAVNEY